MQKLIVFVVGHENWGKSSTLRDLKQICGVGGFRVKIKRREFFVRSMSNDDEPIPYKVFMERTVRLGKPAVIAALCPKLDKHNQSFDPEKYIGETLEFLRDEGYELFFWVIKHQWKLGGEITENEIERMSSFGQVFLFEKRDSPSEVRAKNLRSFVSNIVAN